jgi:hypothetical protein
MFKNIIFAKKIKMGFHILFFISVFSYSFSCKSDSAKAFASGVGKDLTSSLEIPTIDGKVNASDMAVIEFEKTTHDFGKVKEGEVIEYAFKFKNTGSKNLILLYHEASCGCTVPDFSRDPFSPGKGGEIKIAFDTKGRKLNQRKKVRIFSNTYPNVTELTVQGYVIPN